MKNLKTYKKTASYLVAGALTFSSSALLGYTPFVSDVEVEDLSLITQMDESGKIYREFSEDKGMDTGVVEHYSRWSKNNDGYSRTVNYYMSGDYDIKQLKRIAKGKEDIEPSFVSVENRKDLSKEEINNNREYITAFLVEEDKKRVIKVEPDYVNEFSTAAAVAVFLLFAYGIKNIESFNEEKEERTNKLRTR